MLRPCRGPTGAKIMGRQSHGFTRFPSLQAWLCLIRDLLGQRQKLWQELPKPVITSALPPVKTEGPDCLVGFSVWLAGKGRGDPLPPRQFAVQTPPNKGVIPSEAGRELLFQVSLPTSGNLVASFDIPWLCWSVTWTSAFIFLHECLSSDFLLLWGCQVYLIRAHAV